MELVEGPSLADLIKDGPLSLEAVTVLLKRIGAGLDAVHRLGITHRDVSPDNIILPRSDPGRAKLIDFGIARNPNGTETIIADRFAGKLNFASPEHFGLNGGHVTPKSDVYSFGLTLAAALTGTPLDLGSTQVEMLRCRQTVPDLGRIDPRIRKILARMLQPDPSERPDTISELIEPQENGSVVLARQVPPRGSEPRRTAPRRWGIGIAAALALVLVGGGLAAWSVLMREIEPGSMAVAGPDDRKTALPETTGAAASTGSSTGRAPATETATRQDVPREPASAGAGSAAPERRAPDPPDDPGTAAKEAETSLPIRTSIPAARTTADQAPPSGRTRRDCATCPPLVDVPAGTFTMGSATDASEKPVHAVRIRAFLLSRSPITVSEWNACHAAGSCEFHAEGPPDQSATNLSWDDAQQYLRWISATTRKAYRLPSEAEWEYAARGGTRTRFWWGDQFRSEMAPCRSAATPPPNAPPMVADFPENPFGLLATTCVVAQWTSDCWHKNYRGSPVDGSAWDAPNCRQRVLRGGTWRSRAESERVTSRDFYDAAVRYPGNGVRIARDL